MITTIEEAHELCKKFGVNLKEHKTVFVTENNNIYLSDSVDPSDLGKCFYLKGGKEEFLKEIEEVKEEKPFKKNK